MHEGATGPDTKRRPGASLPDAAIAIITHCCAAMLAFNATSKCADAVGAGGRELTTVPSGQRRAIGANRPAERGKSWASTSVTSLTTMARMMCVFELKKWLVCGAAPSKSKTIWSPSMVKRQGTLKISCRLTIEGDHMVFDFE